MAILRGVQILIVEDEAMLREIYHDVLSESGALIYEASNGFEALEWLKTNKFDLIITDLNMPKMDGVQLLKEIQEGELHSRPIIVFTGRPELLRQSPYRRGITAVIEKPMSVSEIAKLAKRIIDSNRNRIYPRIILEGPIAIEVSLLNEWKNLSILNISEGGFFIRTERTLPSKGTLLNFKFTSSLFRHVILHGEGIVAWVHENNSGFGVEIKKIDPNGLYQEILCKLHSSSM